MNSAIGRIILTAGNSWALLTLVKATLVAAIGLTAALLAGRKRAAFRHALLASTFGVLLALPVISNVAPTIGIGSRSAPQPNLTARPALLHNPAARAAITPAPSQPSSWPAASMLEAIWIAGIVILLVPAATGLQQVLRLRRSGLPWAHGQSVADDFAARAGIRRHVQVLLHEELAGPMTCGVMRPVIVLPAGAGQWSAADLQRAIVHELEHVARHDWIIHCAARAICALYWFHPLTWMALRRLDLEAERACDDAVLDGSEPTAYADQLVAVARRLSAASKPPLLAMANRADLASRVNAVLDSRQRRGRAGARCVVAATAAAAAMVFAISPVRIVAAPPQAGAAPIGRIRTDTKLVVMPAKVTNPAGSPILGLTAADFAITEDGVPQAIRLFEFQNADGPDSAYYLLGYYPRNDRQDGQFRQVEIVVKTASTAKVLHRPGYYPVPAAVAPPNAPASNGILPAYDRPPVLLSKREPEYSEEARRAKYQGTVLLNVEVDTGGQITNIRVVRSLGLGLDEKAIDAVKQWRFRPATKDGNAVSAPLELEVNFRLL